MQTVKSKNLTDWLENQKISVHKVIGEYQTILGLIGDTSKIDIDLIQGLDIVEKVKEFPSRIKTPTENFIRTTRLLMSADIK